MKEIEELFRKLRHHYRLFLKGSNDSFIKMNEIETALLSRFRELQKYKDTFYTLWDFCSEQTQKQIELVKRAEKAEEQVDKMKCCGNCKYNLNIMCDLPDKASTDLDGVCENWKERET